MSDEAARIPCFRAMWERADGCGRSYLGLLSNGRHDVLCRDLSPWMNDETEIHWWGALARALKVRPVKRPEHTQTHISNSKPMRPVASKAIPGTSWQEVTTDTGHVYWWDGQTAVWEMPEAVKSAGSQISDLAGVPPAVGAGKGAGHGGGNKDTKHTMKKAKPAVVVDAKTMAAMRRAKANGAVLAPEYEELLAKELAAEAAKNEKHDTKKKKKRKKDGEAGSKKKTKMNRKAESGPTAAYDEFDVEFDVEFDEDDVLGGSGGEDDGPVSVEDIEESYRVLLREHGVHQFSRYETVERKLVGDPRFVAVDPKRRRGLFEAFCAEKGMVGGEKETEKRGKGDSQAKTRAEAAFLALLSDAVKDHMVEWSGVAERLKADTRYKDASDALEEGQMRRLFDDHRRKLRVAPGRRSAGVRAHKRGQGAGERRELHHSRQESLVNYSTLLAEVVRVPESTWEEAVVALHADPQRRMLEDEVIAKSMYAEHVERLRHAAKLKLFKLFEASFDKGLSAREVSERCEEMEEFLEFSDKLIAEVWSLYCVIPRAETGGGVEVGDGAVVRGEDLPRPEVERDS